MTMQSVLTGDLIHSQRTHDVQAYIKSLKTVLKQLSTHYRIQSQVYRGDGFQVVMDNPEEAFVCAVALRAALIASSPDHERWDARLSIGIGEHADKESYGEAFVLSGHGLDNMKKSTLAAFSSHASFQERVALLTEFTAAIIDNWTVVEAQTVYLYLTLDTDQQTIANQLGKSRVTINKALQRAQTRLLDSYLEHTRRCIRELAND